MIKLTAENILNIGCTDTQFADHLVVRHMAKYGEYKSFSDFTHDLLFELYLDAVEDAGLRIKFEQPYKSRSAANVRDYDLIGPDGELLLSGGHFSSEGEALKSCLIRTFASVDTRKYFAAAHARCWQEISSKN
jgi:hypothetical protein